MSELVKIELTEEALQRIIDHSKVHINSTVNDVVDEKLPSAVATKMDKQNPSGTGDMHITGNYYDGTGSIVGASDKLYTIEIKAELDNEGDYVCSFNRTYGEIWNNFELGNIILVHLTDIETGYDGISTNISLDYISHKLTFEIIEEFSYPHIKKFIVELRQDDTVGACGLYEFAPEATYSTSEKKVGTWIDGTTIYQSTIDLGFLPNATSKVISTNIVASDIIKYDIFASGNVSGQYKKQILTIPNGYVGGGDVTSVAYIDSNDKIVLSITTSSNRTSYAGYATVQYTKPSN